MSCFFNMLQYLILNLFKPITCTDLFKALCLRVFSQITFLTYSTCLDLESKGSLVLQLRILRFNEILVIIPVFIKVFSGGFRPIN